MNSSAPGYISPLVSERTLRHRGFGADLSRLPRAEREQIYRRRRIAGAVLALVCLVLFVKAVGALSGGGSTATADKQAPELPRGGRQILPHSRVVAFYGAPQDPELGVLGETSTAVAGAKLIQQAQGFERPGRPVLPALELISTLAQAAPGDDGLYRLRQSDATIRDYLREARKIKALLVLDIQPGHAEFMDEVRALEPYLL